MSQRYLGAMIGTSLDGIDIAIAQIGNAEPVFSAEILAFRCVPISTAFRDYLLSLIKAVSLPPQHILAAHVLCGRVIGRAIRDFLQEHGVEPHTLTAIGLHGPTFQHWPNGLEVLGENLPGSWQLGDPHTVSLLTGIPTISDFRAADVAVGGQGAPLVPFLDDLLFRHPSQTQILLNLGGIANMTLLRPNEAPLAFDSGPANMLIDSLMRRHPHFPAAWDEGGQRARAGLPSQELLARCLQHPYFSQDPPKSTGRELFGDAFCEAYFSAQLPYDDLVATATQLTATSIVDALKRCLNPGESARLVVSGGGAHNTFLLELLAAQLPLGVELTRSSALGINEDAKEALLMACLAWAYDHGIPANVPRVTGAKHPVVLGSRCGVHRPPSTRG